MTSTNPQPPRDKTPTRPRRMPPIAGGRGAARDTWRAIRLVAGREYKQQVARPGFALSTLVLLFAAAAAAFIPTLTLWAAGGGTTPVQVVVVNLAGAVGGLDEKGLAARIDAGLNGQPAGSSQGSAAPVYAISFQPPANLNSLESQVQAGHLDLLLVLWRAPDQALRLIDITASSADGDTALPRVQALAGQLTLLDSASRLGLSAAQSASLLAPPSLSIIRNPDPRPLGQAAAGYALALAGGLLVCIATAYYANAAAMGVGEEKSHRVMELLVSAASPFALLAGMVAGVGAAGLTQMGALAAAGIAALLLQNSLQAARFGASASGFAQYLASVSIPYALLFLVYFLLNYLLYATLGAGLSVMVSRRGDARRAVQVPALLIAASGLLVFLGALLPDSPWVQALSYIPFFSAGIMLARTGRGASAGWEIAATFAVMLAAIALSAWFAARAYRAGTLMNGPRPGLRQMLKMIREK